MSDLLALRLLNALDEAARISGDSGERAGLRLGEHLGIGRFLRFRTVERLSDGTRDGERVLLGLAHGLIQEAAEELSSALTRRGIRHFFVKGIALANRLYEPGEREMADIDLHIDPDARGSVIGTLEELGYHVPPDSDQSGPAALRSSMFAGRYTGSSQLEHIGLDLAWGLDPVDRLLPRPDRQVPQDVWDCLDTSGSLPTPQDAHHVALLVHHLVHHDMLHFRGLVDLALLWPRVTEDSSHEIENLAAQIGVSRATRLLADVLRNDLGAVLVRPGPPPDDRRGRLARRMLVPVMWCSWASQATDTEFVEINPRRIRRRILLIDSLKSVPHLLRDAVFPPREYLRWRWPESRSITGALARHIHRLVGKLAKLSVPRP
jgi:hypothetical protein